MATRTFDASRWKETARRLLSRDWRQAITGSSQRELVKQAGVVILIFDDRLVDLVSWRQSRHINPAELSGDSLAAAVSDMLGPDLENNTLVLLLPPHEFATTAVDMPGMSRDALVSALKLQADNLLPSFSGPLAVAALSHGADETHQDVALWLPEQRLDELYQAFQQQGLSLTGVMPRCLALVDESGKQEIRDADSQYLTRVVVRDGAILQWLHVSRLDLQQEIFKRQWRQELATAGAETKLDINGDNLIEAYQRFDKGRLAGIDYCFIPQGAQQAMRQVEKGRRTVLAVAAAAALVFLGSLPFLFQTFESYRLRAILNGQRDLSTEAREDRQVVQNFERQWGVITDFPRQDVAQILFTLQSVLSPEQLTALELSDGIIAIEGESEEPQAILQRLESHPMFTEVIFSRPTSNTRYYIDLRLSTVNFEGYMVRYFAEN